METKKFETSLTAEEYEELQALRAERAKREEAERKQDDLRAYRELVDETIEAVVPQLTETAVSLLKTKEAVFELFDEVIETKEQLLGVTPEKQRSHTFTNSESTKRITVGYHATDGYLDTVAEGIEMVKNHLESLAGDQNSQSLVSMILQLLSTDKRGNLQASRVVQLRKHAEESGSEQFMEGVRVIEEAYNPTKTRRFIACQVKDKNNAWRNIPLGMTDVDKLSDVIEKVLGDEEEDV